MDMGRTLSRRGFLRRAGAAGAASAFLPGAAFGEADRPPNVLLIMTDDQGYGDLGCHGNPQLKTPHQDRLYAESLRLTQFHVCPVCSPTRASLMTGRYNYRTGVVDTYLGRSMMHGDETTMAELFAAKGYRTGIFGKWHLGDNYPLRAMDQGFQESLVHHGGGIGQPSDPPGNSYFDPILKRNGVAAKHEGYCTDIFTDATMAFVEENKNRPFFAYLATNAPHTPLEIGDEYVAPYRAAGLNDRLAKFYGMIANFDENLGRLLKKLDELGLAENTIVVFLTDNGSSHVGGKGQFNAGQRGWKGSVYQGGIRVPCFIRWKAALKAGQEVERIAAHIDLLPTLLEACGAELPADLALDGMSLLPLLREGRVDWPDRNLFFQWHRGDEPEAFRQCAVRSQRYKLVNGTALYDLQADSAEAKDIAAEHPDIVASMRAAHEAWLQDVGAKRGYAPPRIYLGSEHEDPVTLTRQDWRRSQGWADKDLGYWEVDVRAAGGYDVTLRFEQRKKDGDARLKLGGVERTQPLREGAESCVFEGVGLAKGPARLEAELIQGETVTGVRYVDVARRHG